MMRVVSTPYALVFVFQSQKELHGVIGQLQRMAEWVETEDVEPPYLYSLSEDTTDKQQIDELLDELKRVPEDKE